MKRSKTASSLFEEKGERAFELFLTSFLPVCLRSSRISSSIVMATTLPPIQISWAEASYLCGGIVSGIRGDGRGAADVRTIAVATGVLPSASGSSEARMAGAHVMVGVKVRGNANERARETE